MRTKTVLKKARDRLEGHWVQGHFARFNPNYDRGGRHPDRALVCALGAINWAVCGDPDKNVEEKGTMIQRYRWRKAVNTLAECIQDELGYHDSITKPRSTVIHYNDSCIRREEDVLRVFDCAIGRA